MNSAYEAEFKLKALMKTRSCLKPSTARNYLQNRLLRYKILDLYQWRMPDKVAQHPHSDRYQSCVKGEDTENNHSRLEVGFLQQLHTVLPGVPWDDEWWDEGLADEGLPLIDAGINIHDECVLENLKPEFLVVTALSSEGTYLLSDCQCELEDLIEKSGLWPTMQRALDSPIALLSRQRNTVRRRFNKEPMPIRFTPMAVNLIDKDTGNYWLDVEEDYERFPSGSSCHMDWDRESFVTAERHGNRVKDYSQKVDDLFQWIEANPKDRLTRILDIWNQCLT